MDDAIRWVRASWVITNTGPPIRDGAIAVEGNRIVHVTSGHAAPRTVEDLGDCILLPGWVNAHCHLEFSNLRQPMGHAQMGFVDWIRKVIQWKRSNALEPESTARKDSIRAGLAESAAAGTALIGEITTAPWRPIDPNSPGPGVVQFLEQLGVQPNLAQSRFEELDQAIQCYPAIRGNSQLLGLSPHAPYSVHSDLFHRIVESAKRRRLPLAMHLAESRDELDWLKYQSGPFAGLFAELGYTEPWDSLRMTDYLTELSCVDRALVIHGNYLSGAEIDVISKHRDRMSVVYCPRTHLYFGHEPYPLIEFLKAGINVAVGTDSRASNPDLSMLEELKTIRRLFPDLSPDHVFRMGTINGATALGQSDNYGTLEPGKTASIQTIACPPDLDTDPLHWLV